MFKIRLSLAFAALVGLVCIQAAVVYWGSTKVYDYAQHSRLASDILSELLNLSANKQRLRVWASQRLMNAGATVDTRDRLIDNMRQSAANLKELAHRDVDLWRELSASTGAPVPPEVQQLAAVTDLLDVNIDEVRSRLLRLAPLQPVVDFAEVWTELNDVFDKTRGRDLRELVNGAIERQRQAVPVARAATERGLNRLRLQAIGLALLTLAAAAAMALHLNRRLNRPLGRLLRGTQALAAGDLGHRVALGSHDEFDRVAEHFNAMAAELQLHRDESEAAQRRLEDAVAARTAELSAAHATLQRVDQRRRQLFVDLSHELRTPATAIRGEAEIALRGGDKPGDEYRQTLARIVAGVAQLAKVTDDLLLIARTEAEQLVMHLRAVELPALLADAAEHARAIGAVHGVTVQLEPPAAAAPMRGGPMVHADADRLRQAVVIVLDNAVRYSLPGGRVQIGWRADGGDAIEIVVRDDGIGIDADELPEVFQRFVRGRLARAQRPDGTGIGLSIAHAIVTAHQGEIGIESAARQGTTVRIRLPRAPTESPVVTTASLTAGEPAA